METQTLEVIPEAVTAGPVERILILEDHEWINNFKGRVESMLSLLNQINQSFQIETPDKVPTDPQLFIFQKFLAENETARAMHEISPLKFESITFPGHWATLLAMLKRWKQIDRSALEFVRKNGSVFEVDRERLEKHLDQSARRYISRPDQIQRLEMATAYNAMLGKLGVTSTERNSLFLNPMIFRGIIADPKSKFPELNIYWIEEWGTRLQF